MTKCEASTGSAVKALTSQPKSTHNPSNVTTGCEAALEVCHVDVVRTIARSDTSQWQLSSTQSKTSGRRRHTHAQQTRHVWKASVNSFDVTRDADVLSDAIATSADAHLRLICSFIHDNCRIKHKKVLPYPDWRISPHVDRRHHSNVVKDTFWQCIKYKYKILL